MPPRLQWDGEDHDALAVNLKNCRGSEFQDALAKIRDVPGRKFDFDRKLWLIPAEAGVAERVMQSIRAEADEDIKDWIIAGRIKEQEELSTALPEDAELLVPWATERADFQPEFIKIGSEQTPFEGLMQHQRPLVDIAARVRKLIIADDMGLGKTGSAISAVEEFRLRNPLEDGSLKVGPKLVVAPNSVKGSWQRQLNELWLGEDEPVVILNGSTPKKRHEQLVDGITNNAWVITNWEQLRIVKKKVKVKRRNGGEGTKTVTEMKEPLFEQTDWLAVIADEVHRAKNRKAQSTQGLWRTRADDGLMLAMSGTPLMNSPDELWAILHWLFPKEYTAYWRFFETYVDYTEGFMGKVITGVRNPDALRFELTNRLVRRTQGQVLDLPGKGRFPVDIDLNPGQRKLYDQAEKEMWLEVEQKISEGDKAAEKFAAAAASGATVETLYKIPNGAARTVRLRQILESPALLGADDDSAVLDACVEKILDSGDEQWSVFTEFAGTPALLVERLRKQNIKAVEYTGAVSTDDRTRIEREFQAGEIQVVVGTIKSMYQGITLTAGHLQFWVSRDWVPDVNEQGEDRHNRIGQTKRVLVFIAQPRNTVATQKIEPLNRLKERIVRSVIYKDNIEEGK